MKEIKGYVCLADTENRDILYGRGIDELPYSNLSLNELTPYSIGREATLGRTALLKNFKEDTFKKIEIAIINLELAEDYEESREILKRENLTGLIIVSLPAKDDPEGGRLYHFLGNNTFDAGLLRGEIKRFDGSEDFTGKENFFEALGIISEIGRQTQLKAWLAILRLNVVE